MEMALGGVYLGQLAVAALGVMAISSRVHERDDPHDVRRHAAAAQTCWPPRPLVVGGARARRRAASRARWRTCSALPLLSGNGYTVANGYAPCRAPRSLRGDRRHRRLPRRAGAAQPRRSARSCATPRPRSRPCSALLWVPLIVVSMLPMDVGLKVARFCPMLAGLAIQRTVERSDSVPISPGAGLALFCVYAAAALAGGFWLARAAGRLRPRTSGPMGARRSARVTCGAAWPPPTAPPSARSPTSCSRSRPSTRSSPCCSGSCTPRASWPARATPRSGSRTARARSRASSRPG